MNSCCPRHNIWMGALWQHQSKTSQRTNNCYVVTTSQLSCEEILQKFWTLEEAPEIKQTFSPVEKLVVEDFTVHHKRDKDGRFIVRLPFKSDVTHLGESRPQALKRFLSLERRLHNL